MIDPTQALPPMLLRTAAFLFIGVGIFLVFWHARLADRAATLASGGRARGTTATKVGVFLAAWLAAALVLADRAHFPLEHEEMRPVISALVALGPFAVAFGWIALTEPGRAINAATVPASLISVQAYRIIGFVFLFPYLAYGALPRGFALPAGIGDVLIGVTAPIVARAIAQKRRGAYGWAVAWNFLGIIDLIAAPASAVRSGAPVIFMFPIALAPLFLGPPLGILTHICSLRNLGANRWRLTAPAAG